MRHIVDPRQNRLFDPFHGLFGSQALRLLAGGWQGVFRHVLLEVMPVSEVSEHFHPTLGAPTKELYSMAGLVFLADFQDWTAAEAAEAYMFRTDVQYALNLEPGAEVSTRTVERYQRLFREDELAGDVFEAVTRMLAGKLELDVAKQRLDSTHLFSHMATFGRTKLMAVAVKRFLTQVKRHAPDDYAALPDDFRRRYEPSPAQLFSGAKDADGRQRSRQQAAEDLLWVIERFADRPDLAGRSTYKALVTIFHEQCEVVEGKVAVRKKTGGDVTQNPSDPDATYDGHKGPGYQVQIAETCSDANDVQLITGALPQTACEYDGDAVVPVLEQLERSGLLPEEMMADTHYGSDENVQAAEGHGRPRGRARRAGPGPRARFEGCRRAVDRRLRDRRTHGKRGGLPGRTRAAVGRAGDRLARRRDDDADDTRRNAGRGVRGLPLLRTVPGRPHPRRPLFRQLHGQATADGRPSSRTGNRRLPGPLREAVGNRIDEQRREEPAGPGPAARAQPRGGVPSGAPQTGRLECAASGGVGQAPRVDRDADGTRARRERPCAIWASIRSVCAIRESCQKRVLPQHRATKQTRNSLQRLKAKPTTKEPDLCRKRQGSSRRSRRRQCVAR